MSPCLPALLVVCVALLTSCDKPALDTTALEEQITALQEKVRLAKSETSEVRASRARLEKRNDELRQEIHAIVKATQDGRAEIEQAKVVLEKAVDRGESIVGKFVPGAQLPELKIGDRVFKDITVKQFDGRFLSFSHVDGAGKVEVPEKWQRTQDFESLGERNGVSLSSLVIKPYQPLPKEPKAKPTPKPRSSPPAQNYVAKNPINPKWPLWFRPGGWNYSGSAMSPLKQKEKSSHCQ